MPHEDYCYALERENHALNEKYESQATQLARANARIEALSQQEWLSRKLAVAAEPGGIMACEPSRLDTLNDELQLARQANEAQHQQLAVANSKLDVINNDFSALEDQLTTLNEKYANCVRQLTEAHARIDRFETAPKGWWHKEVEELKQQLAAALAACKVKDEALELIALDDCCTSPAPIAQEALSIQPDDSALKAWLGEPVMYLDKDGCTILPEDMEGNPRAHWQSLYAPKGMK